MEWIKIEDRKPEVNKVVLVTFKSGFDNRPTYTIELARYCNDGLWNDCYNEYELTNVIAWQDLPDAFVEEEFKNHKQEKLDGHRISILTEMDNVPNEPHYTVQYNGRNSDGKSFIDAKYFKTKDEALNLFMELITQERILNAHVYDTNMSTIKRLDRPVKKIQKILQIWFTLTRFFYI